jgi:hypothetical protein
VIVDNEDSTTDEASCSSSEPHLLTQWDLNDLVRDLNLSKKRLTSWLKGWNLLQQGTKVCFFRNRQDEFKSFFYQENDLVFFNDICSIVEALGYQHNTPGWCLFIDSSKVSLKAVLLHNGNKYVSAFTSRCQHERVI